MKSLKVRRTWTDANRTTVLEIPHWLIEATERQIDSFGKTGWEFSHPPIFLPVTFRARGFLTG